MLDKIKEPYRAAFEHGRALHKTSEAFFFGEEIDLSKPMSQLFLAGAYLLPNVEGALRIEVEGVDVLRWKGCEGRPEKLPLHIDTANIWHGEPLMLSGFRDLAMQFEDAAYLVDYKTTSSFKWALGPAELANDTQAQFYALDIMQAWKVDTVHARWIYFLKGPKQDARATDHIFSLKEIEEKLIPKLATADTMRRIIRLKQVAVDLPQNSEACGDYGGCFYGSRKGGPCDGDKQKGGWAMGKTLKDVLEEQILANPTLPPEAKDYLATRVAVPINPNQAFLRAAAIAYATGAGAHGCDAVDVATQALAFAQALLKGESAD